MLQGCCLCAQQAVNAPSLVLVMLISSFGLRARQTPSGHRLPLALRGSSLKVHHMLASHGVASTRAAWPDPTVTHSLCGQSLWPNAKCTGSLSLGRRPAPWLQCRRPLCCPRSGQATTRACLLVLVSTVCTCGLVASHAVTWASTFVGRSIADALRWSCIIFTHVCSALWCRLAASSMHPTVVSSTHAASQA